MAASRAPAIRRAGGLQARCGVSTSGRRVGLAPAFAAAMALAAGAAGCRKGPSNETTGGTASSTPAAVGR